MKLLFDQNISFRVSKKLIDLYPDCKHVSDCGLMNCEDTQIWEYARKHGFTIVTFDSDFYDISIINGHPPKIIWIRSGNLISKDMVELLIKNRDIIELFLCGEDFKDISCLEVD